VYTFARPCSEVRESALDKVITFVMEYFSRRRVPAVLD
jgi:hypothetical protein